MRDRIAVATGEYQDPKKRSIAMALPIILAFAIRCMPGRMARPLWLPR